LAGRLVPIPYLFARFGLIDPEKAKRFDRAQKNYQSTFYRAHAALEAHRKRAAAAGAAREPDIKPPAPDGASAAGPSAAPEAATQVVGETPDGAPAGGPKADLQNDPKTGPERAAAGQSGACRSYHKQAANETVGGIVTAPHAGRTPVGCVKRTNPCAKVGRRCASRTLGGGQHPEDIRRDRS
jgi:hypothetical protein